MRDNRFTDSARSLVLLAQEQARRLGHRGLGCEHLLFASSLSDTAAGEVLRDHGLTPSSVEARTLDVLHALARPADVFDGIDGEALAAIGIDLDAVRRHVEASLGPRLPRVPDRGRRRLRVAPRPGHLPCTIRAKTCLELAVQEASSTGAVLVAAEHVALAVISADGGLVPRIFAAADLSGPVVRAEILRRQKRAS